MPTWTPSKEWDGQDAFIVGGGSSLKDFDFNKLIGKNTIGCNDALSLGSRIIHTVIFGDAQWFHANKWELEKFRGRVVTCAPTLACLNVPWLLQMTRERDGLFDGPCLGWNYSTGAAAVNLAITLGATRIFLLGFDMGYGKSGKSHWHNRSPKPTPPESYKRFIRGFGNLAVALRRFPDVRIFNVTDGSSQLPFFQKISFQEIPKYTRTKWEQTKPKQMAG